MANTYSQIYIQVVFTVKGRKNLIRGKLKPEVEKYMTSIIQKGKSKLIQINCMPDHIHILIGLHPSESISNLVQVAKIETTKFIKKQHSMLYNFSWQRGFGAFSYSHSHLDAVVKYIINQEEHHRKRTFKKEYLNILDKFEVPFNERYLFEFYDDE